MRDPLYRTPLQGNLLQQALARFPDLDVSALEVVAVLEHTAERIITLSFAPLDEYGISRGRFRVMLYLALEEMIGNEAPSPSGIAENLGVTRATMTDLLDGLERSGIVQRRSVGHDRRAQAIHLTDEGRRLFDTLAPLLGHRNAQLFAPLTASERKILIELLTKLATQGEHS